MWLDRACAESKIILWQNDTHRYLIETFVQTLCPAAVGISSAMGKSWSAIFRSWPAVICNYACNQTIHLDLHLQALQSNSTSFKPRS